MHTASDMTSLQHYLKQNSLTVEGFAVIVKCHHSTISRIARGKIKPRLKLAKRIEEKTGGAVTVTEMYGLEKRARLS
jgi:DNA-binding XRE family transcriptional regulator